VIRKILLALLVAIPASAGVLTNKAELEEFKVRAVNGTAPYASLRSMIISGANEAWAWGDVSGSSTGGGGVCTIGGDNTTFLTNAGAQVLAMAAGAILTSNSSQANSFKTSARNHILDLTDTTFTTTPAGSFQCTLDLAVSIPVWIEAALLLEEQNAFSNADRTAFANWLASVYRHPAWASRVRRNNWGTAGSLSGYLIGTYVPANTVLVEVAPGPATITTIDAKSQHNALQLDRIQTVWEGDSQCLVWGIQPDGGIPDELRRGSTLCDGTHILDDDESLTYQSMHTELLTYHAMAIWRLQNNNLTDLFATDTTAIKRAYEFVIDNPEGSDFPWEPNHSGGLIWAAKHYQDADLIAAADALTCNRCGRNMPYMKVFSLLANNNNALCP
jgi:hypothetical protein